MELEYGSLICKIDYGFISERRKKCDYLSVRFGIYWTSSLLCTNL